MVSSGGTGSEPIEISLHGRGFLPLSDKLLESKTYFELLRPVKQRIWPLFQVPTANTFEYLTLP